MAKRKKRNQPDSAAKALDQIEAEGDRLTEWLTENQVKIFGAAAIILVLAGIYGILHTNRVAAQQTAATELAELQGEYRQAMGADRSSFEIAEPANLETATMVRGEYVERFATLAAANDGTTVGALAALDQSQIQQALGDTDGAIATIRTALDSQSASAPVRPIVSTRLGALEETAGRFAEAAEAYEAAATEANPLRHLALASAARCWAEAGDRTKALEAWGRLKADSPDRQISPYIEARLAELEAGV